MVDVNILLGVALGMYREHQATRRAIIRTWRILGWALLVVLIPAVLACWQVSQGYIVR